MVNIRMLNDAEKLYDIIENCDGRITEKDMFDVKYHIMMLKKIINDINDLSVSYEEHYDDIYSILDSYNIVEDTKLKEILDSFRMEARYY